MDSSFADLFPTDVVMAVQQIINKTEISGEYVSSWENIQQALLAAKLADYRQVPPDEVGVHKDNRGSFGISGADSQHHGEDILDVGFSWKKASDATAFEVPPPSTAETEANTKFNNLMVDLSNSLIPPLTFLKLLSVGGSFTNTFLRQVKGGVQAASEKLADPNGMLNIDHICIDRPALRDAIEKGLIWFTMHWACPQVWPQLPDLVQNALNTEARGQQTEVEVMMAMSGKAVLELSEGKKVDWKKLEEQCRRSLPTCSAWLKEIAKYVEKSNRELIAELSNFQKVIAASKAAGKKSQCTKQMGGEFIAKVADMKWGKGLDKFPYVQNGCLKAMLLSPNWKVKDGFYTMLKLTDIQLLQSTKLLPLVKEAEELMSNTRKLVSTYRIAHKVVLPLGVLDARCILFMVGRIDDLGKGKEFESLSDIAQAFVDDMNQDAGSKFPHPFSSISSPPATGGASAPAPMAQDSCEQMKDLKYQAAKAGFVLGALIAIKKRADGNEGGAATNNADEEKEKEKAKIFYRITELNKDEAVATEVHFLSNVKLGVVKATYEKVLTEWKVLIDQKLTVPLPEYNYNTCSPMQSTSWALDAKRAAATLAVRDHYGANKLTKELDAKLQIFDRPIMVYAISPFKKGELKLVAASTKITNKFKDDGHSMGFSLGDVDGNGEHLFLVNQYKAPSKDDPWVCPFWLIRHPSKHDAEEACKKVINMKLEWDKITVSTAPDAMYTVHVPYFINVKPIKANEALPTQNTTQLLILKQIYDTTQTANIAGAHVLNRRCEEAAAKRRDGGSTRQAGPEVSTRLHVVGLLQQVQGCMCASCICMLCGTAAC